MHSRRRWPFADQSVRHINRASSTTSIPFSEVDKGPGERPCRWLSLCCANSSSRPMSMLQIDRSNRIDDDNGDVAPRADHRSKKRSKNNNSKKKRRLRRPCVNGVLSRSTELLSLIDNKSFHFGFYWTVPPLSRLSVIATDRAVVRGSRSSRFPEMVVAGSKCKSSRRHRERERKRKGIEGGEGHY